MALKIKKFQGGGQAPMQEAPQAQEGGQQGEGQNQMIEMLTQVVQSQDPNAALQFCNMLAEQMQLGSAPQEGQAPAPEPVPQAAKGMKMELDKDRDKMKKGGDVPMKKGMSAIDKYKKSKGMK